MPDSSVVVLPFGFDEASALQAELVGRGISAYLPEISPVAADTPERVADARRVAYTAIWLNEASVAAPIVVVCRGEAARLLPALAFSQRASHRLINGYVIIDGPTPAPAQDWPDAPVWWVLTPDADPELAEKALTARLRGFHVVETPTPTDVIAQAT